VLIKNVLSHTDDLHDGRAIGAYETAEISAEDFQLEHYQARLRDGLIAVLDDSAEPLSVADIKAAIDAASDEDREAVKASFREAEERNESPRKGVLDITKSDDKETT
jgi:hypothetical protein